jgi:DinB superfamily
VTIQESKQLFQMSVDRVKRILEKTADDRLLWSPAPTARTPLAQVAHVATSIHHIHTTMMGTRFATPTMEEADAEFLALELGITRREDALGMLDRNSQAYIDWLDQLSEERLSDMVPLPFDLGEAPLGFMLIMPAWHTNDHAAQMDYIQTCYGDRSWN